MREKFKLWLENDRLFYSTSVILIGITSFGLGRLSANGDLNGFKTTRALVQVVEPIYFPATAAMSELVNIETEKEGIFLNNTQAQIQNTQVVVVGSKNGTKYHLPTCSGAKNIKPENLVTFSSVKEAEMAGYQKAANCPGL